MRWPRALQRCRLLRPLLLWMGLMLRMCRRSCCRRVDAVLLRSSLLGGGHCDGQRGSLLWCFLHGRGCDPMYLFLHRCDHAIFLL